MGKGVCRKEKEVGLQEGEGREYAGRRRKGVCRKEGEGVCRKEGEGGLQEREGKGSAGRRVKESIGGGGRGGEKQH